MAGNITCAGNKGTTIQQHTNRITASYLELQKTARTDIIQTFKIIKRIDSVNQDCRCPQCPSKLMLKKASGTTRGHSEKLQTQRATGYRHHFFSTRVVKMGNSLSEDTVQARTVNELKSRLQRDWRGHPDLYNYNFFN